jgi:D-glycero-alpha-D-manno-heptose-7-phosphate kinase
VVEAVIIVQTPLRISFVGGGTDFKGFYKDHGGCVLSTAIDKCVFVIVKERFDDIIYINYTRKEIVRSIDEINHELVREAMRKTGVAKGVEITTLSDVPADGTGLGSSSSITVALLHALYAYRNELVTADILAQEACEIEIDILGKPIGKQDQYISAYGDLRFISFNGDQVSVEQINLSSEKKRELNSNLLMFHTSITRDSNAILSEQATTIKQRLDILREMKSLALEAKEAIVTGSFDELGIIMDRGWKLKKGLSSRIDSPEIDDIYQRACKAGALGGKIAGAGGGGFLVLYCPLEKQKAVREALMGLRELPLRFEPDGSKVIFNYRRTS